MLRLRPAEKGSPETAESRGGEHRETAQREEATGGKEGWMEERSRLKTAEKVRGGVGGRLKPVTATPWPSLLSPGSPEHL